MKEQSEKTTGGSPANIDEYISGFPPEVQAHLKQIRATIKRVAPDAKEALKYRIPTFVHDENLVHFAAFKHHIGFYPTPSGIEAFKDELSSYNGAKGSIKFPIDRPMPLDLIERIVIFRLTEVQAKAKKGHKRK
jgi:uncharacterized protein YdhG (YjbR/CyaY superfamily)